MNDTKTNTTYCPRTCPGAALLSIVESVANQENSLACILAAECGKINKVVAAYDDVEVLIAIDKSVQDTLERITALEGVLQAKLNAVLPLLTEVSM